MEPDLDRLFDFESHGGLFPQFEGVWDAVYESARNYADLVKGSGPGRKRVAITAAHPLSFAALFLAFAREEVDLFLFNPTWGRVELDTARRVSDAHFEVSDREPGEFLFQRNDGAEASEQVEMGANRLRVMIPTGGTSGRIRFAIHDWSTLAAAAYGFQQHLSCSKMAGHCVLPLYHVSGFMQLVRALLTMGMVVFGRIESFAVEHALLLKESRDVRFLSLVATQLERLLRDESNVARLREYRAIFVGGGPAPVGLLEKARRLRLPLAPTYGMTETAAQVATLAPEQFLAGESHHGRALPHVRIDIVNEEMASERMPAGEVGLIQVLGMSLFRGYYGDGSKLSNLSILTTDLGRMDAAGHLTVLGRADRVVITGGEKVNLREVEIVFEESGLVSDVHAFGLADREWGELLAVAYVPQDRGVGEDVLREVIARELSNYKMPKKWIRLGEIPRNEAGKPMLRELEAKIGT
ncbi:AMP-binding protein [Pelagicoccus sp. SDUM812005]|uniref:AMP-binding protein n=1 Tax=Pelagicoccus sp. SDUM812005 TaxID=3041257 RepID=UPI0028103C33|nr:AMP-binding protein [Pelagicoccus sp. SDUM812005]MDQ8180208.1 AMP-binding protein [Pelagicoccus sp. SDUM812005]